MYMARGHLPAPQQLGWGSGSSSPSPASGGPALRALCSRPQLLGVQLSGRCAAVPTFWASSSQGCSRPQLLGGPALRALCSPAGEVVVQDSSGLGLPGYQWRPAASPALLVVRRPWRRVGSGPLPLSMFAPLDCLFLMEILRQCRAKAVPTVKWPSGTRPGPGVLVTPAPPGFHGTSPLVSTPSLWLRW